MNQLTNLNQIQNSLIFEYMEHQVKKPDWSGIDAMNDLINHLTISIKSSDEQQLVKGYTTEKGNGLIPNDVKNVTIPDIIYIAEESRKMAKNEDDRKELFARKWSEYQTKHEKHSIKVFIESEILDTDEKFEKFKMTVKDFEKSDLYKDAKEWRSFLKEQAEQPDIKPKTSEPISPTHKKKSETKYPDKYYVWYHAICIALGKERPFPNNFSKKEITEYGNRIYETGEGFYKTFLNFDITQTYTFVNSMNSDDRANWKNKLIDISNKDAEIIGYLSKFPN